LTNGEIRRSHYASSFWSFPHDRRLECRQVGVRQSSRIRIKSCLASGRCASLRAFVSRFGLLCLCLRPSGLCAVCSLERKGGVRGGALAPGGRKSRDVFYVIDLGYDAFASLRLGLQLSPRTKISGSLHVYNAFLYGSILFAISESCYMFRWGESLAL
jgi:hypothetical protein